MESELKSNLLRCAETFARKREIELTTLGRMSAEGDWKFFRRLQEGGRNSFTARKYDMVMGWFSENWPDDLPWPDDVRRPESVREAS